MTDEIDKQLIGLLRKDGRLTHKTAASKLGISRIAVKRRINKLCEQGVINITVFVNPTKSGAPLSVVIGLDVIRSAIASTIDELLRQPSVARVTRTSGRFNILVIASFADIDEMSGYILNVLSQMRGIRNIETFILLHNEQNVYTTRETDTIDKDIIRLLQEDGRQSTVSIAKRLGFIPSTIYRRMKKLQNENRVLVLAILDHSKVDWYWPAAVGISVQHPYLLEVRDKVASNPAVDFAFCTTGRYDILASIQADSKDRLFEIIEHELVSINGIRYYEYFISKETKYGPMWPMS